jgi:hypothetical protein
VNESSQLRWRNDVLSTAYASARDSPGPVTDATGGASTAIEKHAPFDEATFAVAAVDNTYANEEHAFDVRGLQMTDSPGQTVGPWTLIEPLGRGGNATVW